MSADALTVDRREMLDALRAISDSFDVRIEPGMLSGGAFSLSDLEASVLRQMAPAAGERDGDDLAFSVLRETIVAHIGAPRDLKPEDRIDATWSDTPLALRSALWERGRYTLDAVRLDVLGRAAGLAMSLSLMLLATAALFLHGGLALVSLGVLLASMLVFLRAPGAMDKDATLRSVAQNLLDNNVAKLIASGARIAPEEAGAILRRLLLRRLVLKPDGVRPHTVFRSRYHPFRLRRRVLR